MFDWLSDESVTELVGRSVTARKTSYSPYSKFPVGAALQCTDGTIYVGCNVENASFGLTVCAERTAVVKVRKTSLILNPQLRVPFEDFQLTLAHTSTCHQTLHKGEDTESGLQFQKTIELIRHPILIRSFPRPCQRVGRTLNPSLSLPRWKSSWPPPAACVDKYWQNLIPGLKSTCTTLLPTKLGLRHSNTYSPTRSILKILRASSLKLRRN